MSYASDWIVFLCSIVCLLVAVVFIIRHSYRSIIRDLLEFTPDCDLCGGSGFSGRGSGYGDVCSVCGGQRSAEPIRNKLPANMLARVEGMP